MFTVGDRIAHPLHGAGIIESITTRKIDGTEKQYFVLRIPVGDMLVMIPVDACEAVGVRPIVEPKQAEAILNSLPELEINTTQNWNKRYRENMEKIKSGDLTEVAAVIKGLMLRELEKGLSNGERKMLHSAKQILISEIVLSESASYDEVEQRINKAVS